MRSREAACSASLSPQNPTIMSVLRSGAGVAGPWCWWWIAASPSRPHSPHSAHPALCTPSRSQPPSQPARRPAGLPLPCAPERHLGQGGPHVRHQLIIRLTGVPPPHALQHGGAAALRRHVQLLAHVGARGDDLPGGAVGRGRRAAGQEMRAPAAAQTAAAQEAAAQKAAAQKEVQKQLK